MQKKFEKKFFVFQIITSELVALYWLYLKQIMILIKCQCVNKQA